MKKPIRKLKLLNNNKSILKREELNPMWKGIKVGIKALHCWIEKRLKNRGICAKCRIKTKCDLANKGIYDRNLKNWEWLCRSCHMWTDGRIKNLKQFNDKKTFDNN